MKQRTSLLLVICFVVFAAIAFIQYTAFEEDGEEQIVCETIEECLPLAEKGDVDAQLSLGAIYGGCEGDVSHDYKEAVKWYRKAAEQGYAEAQFNLGVMYYNGAGVPHDYKEAVKWYRKAAGQRYAGAQSNLGIMYFRGKGVPQDYKKAVKWYRKAAEQGYAEAQFSLGVMYYNGEGVPQSYVKAYAWFNISATQGNYRAAANRDVFAATLRPSTIAKAQKLSKEYYKKYVEPFQ